MKKFLLFLLLVSAMACSTEQKPLSPRFNHVMLYVSDMEASIKFYTTAFDLKVTNRLRELSIENPDGTKAAVEVNMAFLKFPGQDFVYEMAEQEETATGAALYFQHVGVEVYDIDAAFKRLEDTGAEVMAPIRLVEGPGVAAKNAFFKGPDGEVVELMEMISGEF
jgi:catechol 2,3-dioxygenase-like lactoylglutathione lyase family enzyme